MKKQKRLLVIKNIEREGAGLWENLLKKNGVIFKTLLWPERKALPDIEAYEAFLVMGGPQSASDQSVAILSELAFVREIFASGKPYLGICLGLQLGVKAAGGDVLRHSAPETGFFDSQGNPYTVTLTEEGKADPLLKNLPEIFPVFQLHGETVKLTPAMTLLGTDSRCAHQIVKIAPKAYGFQGHPEVTPEQLGVWAEEDPDLAGYTSGELVRQFRKIQEDYQKTAEAVMENFLALNLP